MPIKKTICALIFASTPIVASAKAIACPTESPQSLSVSKTGKQQATSCASDQPVYLRHSSERRSVSISKDGRTTLVKRIDKGYTPELIGMTAFIRFLPNSLQPYTARGVILFNTVERSTGGNGGGQCGSGYELYLNAANVSRSPARVLGRVKIGSCLESTTLYDMENGPYDFSSFSVQNGRLAIKFLLLKGELEKPTALLSDDFQALEVSVQRD
jgi:hypothetical protein